MLVPVLGAKNARLIALVAAQTASLLASPAR